MKKLLLIILLFLATFVKAQVPGSGFTTVTPGNWKYNSTTKQLVPYLGSSVYWWGVSQSQLKAKLDSISSSFNSLLTAFPFTYDITVTSSGNTTFLLPFLLRANSMIYYNGTIVKSDIWSGVGTNSITLNVDSKINDLIKIQN